MSICLLYRTLAICSNPNGTLHNHNDNNSFISMHYTLFVQNSAAREHMIRHTNTHTDIKCVFFCCIQNKTNSSILRIRNWIIFLSIPIIIIIIIILFYRIMLCALMAIQSHKRKCALWNLHCRSSRVHIFNSQHVCKANCAPESITCALLRMHPTRTHIIKIIIIIIIFVRM